MSTPYRDSLAAGVRQVFPPDFFSVAERGRDEDAPVPRSWTFQRLFWTAVLMVWDEGATLEARFENARRAGLKMHPHWTLGRSYSGFAEALARESGLVERIASRLRTCMDRLPAPPGRRRAFAVDGTRIEAPRTAANEAGLGCAGRDKTAPQVTATTLWDLDLRLPRAFRVGAGTESERRHLDELLEDLPAGSTLVADAGFVSFPLCRRLADSGRDFLLRVGGNVTLIAGLGGESKEAGDACGAVDLWPERYRGEPPLALRLIRLEGVGEPVHLVTNVLDEAELTDEEARELYAARWSEEVFHRDFKQTMDRGTLWSRTPKNCVCEASWVVLGTWLLGLLTALRQPPKKVEPRLRSTAQARNAVRRCIQRTIEGKPARCRRRRAPNAARKAPRRRGRAWKPRLDKLPLSEALALARLDGYVRKGSKKARNYPRKKRQKPAGPPKIRPATAEEIQLARAFRSMETPSQWTA